MTIKKYVVLICCSLIFTMSAQDITTQYLYGQLPNELKLLVNSCLKTNYVPGLDSVINTQTTKKIFFSDDNQWIATLDYLTNKNAIKIVNKNDNKRNYAFDCKCTVINLDFNPWNPEQIAIQDKNKAIHIFEKGNWVRILNNNENLPYLAKFISDDEILTFGSSNAQLYKWIVKKPAGDNIDTLYAIDKIALNKKRDLIALTFAHPKEIHIYKTDGSVSDMFTLKDPLETIVSLLFNKDEELLSISSNGTIKNWNTSKVTKFPHYVFNGAMSNNTQLLTLLGNIQIGVENGMPNIEYYLFLYDQESEQILAKFSCPIDSSCQFSSDSQIIVLRGLNTNRMYDLHKWHKLQHFCKARMKYKKLKTDTLETDKVALLQGTLLHVLFSKDEDNIHEIKFNGIAQKTFTTLPKALQKIFKPSLKIHTLCKKDVKGKPDSDCIIS